MATCFVIQPFDGGAFDKRYEDILLPAIVEVGLEPYRVDRDPRVSIPIDEIENGIRAATICLADITVDNPNVWFELGFAIATRKDTILVCSDQRNTPFPFDVQHRNITKYSTQSTRDFAIFRQKLIERLEAIMRKEQNASRLAGLPQIAQVEGLDSHEIVALATIAQNLDTPPDSTSPHLIRQDMQNSGYTKLAVMVSLISLSRKGLIEYAEDTDWNGNSSKMCKLTEKGMDWLVQNQDRLLLRHEDPPLPPPVEDDDDIPF